jgi:hypothetical protein
MRITESRLRSIIRQVLKEQVLKEEWWDDDYNEEKGYKKGDWRVDESLVDYWRKIKEETGSEPVQVSFNDLRAYMDTIYYDVDKISDEKFIDTVKTEKNQRWLGLHTNEMGESVVIFKNSPNDY